MADRTTNLAKVKQCARKSLPNDTKLLHAILVKRDNLREWEALVKLDVYSIMLDARFRNMMGG